MITVNNETLGPYSVYYNEEPVYRVFFQDTSYMDEPEEIWCEWDYTGIHITWEELKRVCELKQLGVIDEWPYEIEDFKKHPRWSNFTIYSVLDGVPSYPGPSLNVRLIGVDIDGPGVLTFMMTHNVPDGYEDENYILENLTTYRYDYEAKQKYHIGKLIDYVKPLKKQCCDWVYDEETGTYKPTNYRVEEKKIWLPSCAELGIESEAGALFTEGVNTPYVFEDPTVVYDYYSQFNLMTKPDWTVRCATRDTYVVDGVAYNCFGEKQTGEQNSRGLYEYAFCFAIG